MAGQRWLPIESNPQVMNQFLHKMGMPKLWAMTDVYGLDDMLLDMLPQPVVALMLLFPINDKYEDYVKGISFDKPTPPSVYYMKQTISNACGTVAMLHGVANNLDVIDLEDGILKEFLEKTKDETPEEKAKKLEDSADVCDVHDTIAKQGQTAAPSLEDHVDYHFIAFVEKDGILYDLDGRKPAPVDCGPTSKETFLKDAAKQCKSYMERDPDNINFTMIALAAADM